MTHYRVYKLRGPKGRIAKAKDVEAALVEIVAAHGVRSTDEAIAFVSGLKRAGRYQADVY